MGSKKCCVSNNNSANAFLDFPDGGPSLSLTYALVASSDRVLVVGWNPRIRELEITSEVIEPVPQAAAFSMCQRRLRKTQRPPSPSSQRAAQAPGLQTSLESGSEADDCQTWPCFHTSGKGSIGHGSLEHSVGMAFSCASRNLVPGFKC